MNAGPIAHRYAKALLKFVQETGAGEQVYSQACVLVVKMRNYRRLADAVQKHSELGLQRKIELLETALGEPISPELSRFILLVSSHARIDCFERMLYSFIQQYLSSQNIKVGKLVTACPASGLRERLEGILQERIGSKVHLDEEVNPDILGGFILNIEDLMMDASVEGSLHKLHRELIEKTT